MQVDRRGAGRTEFCYRGCEAGIGWVLCNRKRHTIGGRGADQRRTTNLHCPDRPHCVLERIQPHNYEFVRQFCLIDDLDRAPIRS